MHESVYPAEVSVVDFGAKGDGLTDDTASIRKALNSGAARVRIPIGTYLINRPLEPLSGQHLLLDGTIRIADAKIAKLTKDVPSGSSQVWVDNPDAFAVGEWIVLHDENLPIQGGGRKVRRQSSGGAFIVGCEGNCLILDRQSARSYSVSANALVATFHSGIWIRHSGVRISGSGSIQANRQNRFNTAPGYLDRENSEDWSAASGIVAMGEGRLTDILIENVTVCDAPLHGIGLVNVENGVIRNTTVLRSHDKNITLHECRDCRIVGNTCCDSEWEDGIMLHQRSDRSSANHRIVIEGNFCKNNARYGIHIGANMYQIQLANNLCVENGLNFSIFGDECSSSGDTAIGTTDRLFTAEAYRPNVLLTGKRISVSNLSAFGTRFVALEVAGEDIAIMGGLLGEMDKSPIEAKPNGLSLANGEWRGGSGEFYVVGDARIGLAFAPDFRGGRSITSPKRVKVIGTQISGCNRPVFAHASASDITLSLVNLSANDGEVLVAPEAEIEFLSR